MKSVRVERGGSKKGTITDLDAQNYPQFTKPEIDEFKDRFRKYDSKSPLGITKYDLVNLIKECGVLVDEDLRDHLMRELEAKDIKKIDFTVFLDMLVIARDKENEEPLNMDYVDCFVAMGGNADQTGYVLKDRIISVIRDDFELDFDIEDFLEKAGVTQDKLDFEAFCLLFESEDSKKDGLSRAQSFMSMLSTRSRKGGATNRSLNIRYKDFERFMEKGGDNKFFS